MPPPRRRRNVWLGRGRVIFIGRSRPDVIDNRVVTDGFNFILVNDASLPVSDASFDIVLSNHVIEHVGERPEQMRHLREIKRVLRRHGKAYLAVPNRWMLVEPHYQLAFLSWIPRSWRTPYLRATGRGEVYDCLPLQMGELERMLAEAGLEGENVGVKAMHATFAIEKPQSKLGSFLANMPDRCLRWLNFAIPTHIYVIRHGTNESA